jgi:hypothetical protein
MGMMILNLHCISVQQTGMMGCQALWLVLMDAFFCGFCLSLETRQPAYD